MKKRVIALLLMVAIVFTFGACSQSSKDENPMHVDLGQIKRQDLGSAMPKILFAHEGKIGFWGTFGLFIVNGEDGSIYRTLNLENLDHNFLGGEYITRFRMSDDYAKIYFYNEGDDGENAEDVFFYYDVEEDIVREVPVGTGVMALPPAPVFTMEIAGGGISDGYNSNPVYYDENTTVYLHSKDWKVKDLTLCFYDMNSEETTQIKVFK